MENEDENKSKDEIIKELRQKIGELEKLEAQHRQTEKELRFSETKYRGLFENVPDGMYQTTPDGKIISANSALVRMLGYDSEEDLRTIDIAHDLYADPEKRKVSARKFEKEGELRNVELVLKRKDGTQIIILENARAVRDEGGRVLHYEGTLTDITERKKMEKVLQERIKELNCFYNISYLVEKPDASLEEIFHGVVNLIPPTWQYPEITCARIVFKGKEFKTKNFMETAWKQDADIIVSDKPIGMLRVCYLEEKSEGDEGPFLKEERSLLNAIVRRLEKIIERKKTEEALQESEEKYRNLVENMSDIIYTIDESGVVTYISPVIESFSGYSPSEVIGHHFRKFIYPEDLPRIVKGFKDVLSGHTTANEYRLLTKSGETRWMRTSSRPIVVEDRMIGVQGILADINERKKAEELLKSQREELSAFAHTVSHDLKNYIHIIQNYAQFLLLKRGDAEKSTWKIIDTTEKMDKFVTRQLELADAGKVIGEPEKVDFNKMIGEIRKIHDIEIHTEDLPKIKGDPQRLKEAFNNLIDNAIKHGKADEMKISSKKKNDSYIISVKDNGRGISKENIDKIFDVGYSKTGMGFGLAIVKKIVEAHGGSISVESEPEKGATFEIVFPRM